MSLESVTLQEQYALLMPRAWFLNTKISINRPLHTDHPVGGLSGDCLSISDADEEAAEARELREQDESSESRGPDGQQSLRPSGGGSTHSGQ